MSARQKSGDHQTSAAHFVKAQEYTNAIHDRKQTLAHGQSELYESAPRRWRSASPARCVASDCRGSTPAAGQARGEHDLSQAELHFNDAGRVSQKTLLAYAEEATPQPTTSEMYRNADGDVGPVAREAARPDRGHDAPRTRRR